MSWTVELGLAGASNSFTLNDATKGVLGSRPLGDDFARVWTDVSAWVLAEEGIGWRRGASRSQGPWWRYDGGTATFTLDNLDGRFDPLNPASPYTSAGVSELRPSLPVRISLVRPDGSSVRQWIGVVDRWPVEQASMTWSTVTVTCVDGTERLQAADLPELSNPVGNGDTVGQRINRILDRAGWPLEARDIIDDPTMTMQATTMAQAAWTELLLTADSSGGFLWLDRSGRVTFRPRGMVSPDPVARFGGSNQCDVASLTLSLDKDQVFNLVALGRRGSTQQLVEDLDSQALLGEIRAHRRGDLMCSDDAQVMQIATEIVNRYARLTSRVEQIVIEPPVTASWPWWPTLLALELGDTIRVSWQTPDGRTVTRDGLIRSIDWRVGKLRASMVISLLQATAMYTPFVLGSPTAGVLGTSTLAAR
jgi:hypothetical protein